MIIPPDRDASGGYAGFGAPRLAPELLAIGAKYLAQEWGRLR